MTKIELTFYPSKILKKKAEPIENIDEEIKNIANQMLKIMKDNNGIGLAANQANVLKRIFVIDNSQNKSLPEIFINPEIVNFSETKSSMQEGCLSLPGIRSTVTRSNEINIKFQTIDGEFKELFLNDIYAIVCQHEVDHLDGVLFFDRIPKAKKLLLETKLSKLIKKSKK